MPDFQKGKIYKITNDYNNDVYVGHTCDTLVKRLSYHKTHSKQDVNKNRPLYKLINEIGFERFRIELVCDYPCQDKYQLSQKEGEHIRALGTLNKIIQGRTMEQYRNDNRERTKEYCLSRTEHKKEYDKKYREDNKEKLKEYRQNNKDKIKENDLKNIEKRKIRDKQRYDNNKEKMQTLFVCACGCSLTLGCKTRHEKTKKHLDLMEAKNSQQDTEGKDT